MKDFFEIDFPRGLSKYISPVKAKLKNIKFSGARLQVIHELLLVFLMYEFTLHFVSPSLYLKADNGIFHSVT